MSGDSVDADPAAVDDTGTSTSPARANSEDAPDWSLANWTVIVVFTLLTLGGIALAVGRVESVVAIPTTDSGSGSGSGLVTVPLYVYLYAGFGALGYIFTKLMVQLDRYTKWNRLEQLVAMAMRIPAAWILATGIYLFLGDVGSTSGTGGARFAAGVAFLVGLYVNVALKALGSLADRILGRTPPEPERKPPETRGGTGTGDGTGAGATDDTRESR
ncbi:hypothetical protein [Salinigranum sp. GCM10025319]|uniref:hypothetical protein n=1 Tax=Salinigranum sp. GCM10025319 TaxID=3252687 RepID=UPI0036094A7A